MLTRLEEAAILLAPDTPSQRDIQSARALGFIDRDETLKLFNETYPSLI